MINPVIYELELALRKDRQTRHWPWRGGRWASPDATHLKNQRER
ncbi:hypothetical protein [uncultured Roseovarius sp.]|nr:hypothetical protein [uncultured Roseovarius sp.]